MCGEMFPMLRLCGLNTGMARKMRRQRLRDASIRRKIKSRSVNPHNDDPP